jgi:hypothetical protein
VPDRPLLNSPCESTPDNNSVVPVAATLPKRELLDSTAPAVDKASALPLLPEAGPSLKVLHSPVPYRSDELLTNSALDNFPASTSLPSSFPCPVTLEKSATAGRPTTPSIVQLESPLLRPSTRMDVVEGLQLQERESLDFSTRDFNPGVVAKVSMDNNGSTTNRRKINGDNSRAGKKSKPDM